MIVYETVYGSLMDYVCNLFRCRKIHFQLVTALIVVLPRYVHTFTCDAFSQYNSDYFNSWACFFYEIIEFEFGDFFSYEWLRIVNTTT
jgi:ABC-type antimicrobial peptide transport system permease subunit